MTDAVVRHIRGDIPQVDEIMALTKRIDKAAKPKPADLAELNRLLGEIPGMWRVFGDMADINQDLMLDKMASQPTLRASVRQGAEELKRSLGYEHSPMLEQLLIEQVVLCFLRLQWYEYHLTKASGANAAWWEQRVNASQRRFIRASESLGRIRKLDISLQVNIATGGGQQVNVSG